MKSKLALVLPVLLALLFVSNPAFAQDAVDPNAWKGMVALGAGFAIAIAVLGGALGQGRAAAAALEGIARNPQASGKLFTPMIIGLALIESLVIYALLVAYLLQDKIG